MTDYSPLWYWVREREEIRKRKVLKDSGVLITLSGAMPNRPGEIGNLTRDPIFAKYRFCNVRREDDRGTVWIHDNIRKPFSAHRDLWLMLCIARQINWPATLGNLIRSRYRSAWPHDDHFKPADMAYIIDQLQATGAKVFTGAYMISASPNKGEAKSKYISEIVIGELWNNRSEFVRYFNGPEVSLRKTHEMLSEFNGWGPFMAYQAIVDMRFTHLLDRATDLNLWCAAGPGTIRGLNRLHNRPLRFALSQERARSEIRAIYKVAEQETGVKMDFSDVPNILCETDKYLRVKNGEGAPRALYVPGRGC